MREKYLVFTGRPNAGKSTIVRKITDLNIAIGKRPGTTRKISRYPLNKGLVLVDLPGLGRMSGVSRKFEEKINQQIIEFLEANAKKIVLAILVFDISTFKEVTWRLEKKGFKSVDVEMAQFLADNLDEFPLIAANKIDKINNEKLSENLNEFIFRVNKGFPGEFVKNIFTISAKKEIGIGKLKSAIHQKLVAEGYKNPFKKS